MRVLPALALFVPVVLAACGPVPLAQAERSCLENARAATGPRGEARVGVAADSDGIRPVGRFEMSVSSDYIMGRDPALVYSNCVQRKSGQMPSRPLYDQPGWGR
ncbi:hypothetical protein [Paracoccus sp. SCSIO 75233]|uniref:hypothetical protein n=1 Tax=Paracoccus sp. SCSIO 75233 TaxID=3017782 RepID=UPI0022F11DDB|nr:hypothetical protein [Paracoccus sp. SCSIO 75233]WBU52281.1 hypothetical protein PAF12_10595 [Paracoccus sp. SCSIO 75233]